MNKLNQNYINNLYQTYENKFNEFYFEEFQNIELNIKNKEILNIPMCIFNEYLLDVMSSIEGIKINSFNTFRRYYTLREESDKEILNDVNKVIELIESDSLHISFDQDHPDKVIASIYIEA